MRSTWIYPVRSWIGAAVIGVAATAAHADMIKIDTVIIVGSRCPSGATCGTYSLDGTMQETNNSWMYAPFSVTASESTAAAVKKFMDFLAKSPDACRRAGETQHAWYERQIANWIHSNFANRVIADLVNTALRESAVSESFSPAPPACK